MRTEILFPVFTAVPPKPKQNKTKTSANLVLKLSNCLVSEIIEGFSAFSGTQLPYNVGVILENYQNYCESNVKCCLFLLPLLLNRILDCKG